VLERYYRSVDPRLLIENPVHRYVDVPGFDSAHMSHGFGVLIDSGKVSRLWSRPVHHHR